jgi:ribonuclease HII
MPAFDRSLLPPQPDLAFENALWQAGVKAVAGIDEAGRGAMAGPVAAGAVVLPKVAGLEALLKGVLIRQMKPQARQVARERIINGTLAWGWVCISQEIDQMRSSTAPGSLAGGGEPFSHTGTPAAGLPVLARSLITPDSAHQGRLPLAQHRGCFRPGKNIPGCLAAELDLVYPGYGFTLEGYGTQAHRQALLHLGPSPVHRRSFAFHT